MPASPTLLPIPLRLLDDRYGPGNVDETEDTLIGVVQAVMGEQASCAFNFDTQHANPWFHQLLLEPRAAGKPATPEQLQAMAAQLGALGLA
ncbi:hypothetical protein [Stenotrophomonas lactitubi]|uniref:hypothetical protein n=1 Tax=Stenotrophomonas lactitubi TaxID=2045214 RepID=UPI001D3E87B2|nr:hypothetical protein [Stenotrophomonas lactitubi]CAH0284789.1 hypothetical protein SRABI81_04087 [Stenotrophomonas lactitubi]CAH0289554.1 hypothetical protein SRABI66_04240 [Stenotrophomonas lactitubi]CAH0289705.1 hypothetical protein SRABI122_04164 [Stenotrophomonas lactitubi]CAH0293659.1 hypothetical protein SRABI102_04185 [Stenotrophomonas lactitubi]